MVVALAGCGSAHDSGPSLSEHPQLFVVRATGGRPQPLTHDGFDHSAPAWSPRSGLIAEEVEHENRTRVRLVRFDGSVVGFLRGDGGALGEREPSWSPDGRRIAYLSSLPPPDAYDSTLLVSAPGGKPRRLASAAGGPPAWSQDGTTIAFVRKLRGPDDLGVVKAGGGRVTRLHLAGRATPEAPEWLPQGARILFTRTVADGPYSLEAAAVGGKPSTLIRGALTLEADLAPDGRTIAVQATRRRPRNKLLAALLYLQSSHGGPLRHLRSRVSAEPTWSPAGDRLAVSGAGRLQVIDTSRKRARTLVRVHDADIASPSWSPDGRWIVFTMARQPPPD